MSYSPSNYEYLEHMRGSVQMRTSVQERRQKTPIECRDWISERMENALRIAMSKEGEDQAGWLEDAHYLSSVLSILIKEINEAAESARSDR